MNLSKQKIYTNRVVSRSRFCTISEWQLTGLKLSGERICKKGEAMSSTNDSTDRCLETNGDIWFCQVFNMSFFSKSNVRDLKTSTLSPLIDSKMFMWKNYLCKAFGHSIFGLSTWATMRLIVMAIGGWYAEICGSTLLVKYLYKEENTVWYYHEVTSVESGKHIGSRNLKLQVYRDILPVWKFGL